MAAFPDLDTVKNIAPVSLSIRFKTLISEYGSAEKQRKKKWLYPRRDVRVGYRYLDKADARTLWQFYIDRGGGFEAFNLFLKDTNTYTKEYVGTGDGSTTVFNCPSKSASGYAVYIDNVLQTETTDYTFTSSGGEDGADKITFVTAPSVGARITFSFTGYLKIRCTFALDNLDFDVFFRLLTSMEMPLRGELNK